jgi:nucleoporin POM152
MLSMSSLLSILTFGLVTGEGHGGRDSNLAGQHTVRMSPISTAQLNPYSQRFCLDTSSTSVLVPILLNNSNPTSLRYTITPLGHTESSGGKIDSVTLSSRDLKAIENARLERLRLTKNTKQEYYDDSIDDYDEEYPNNDSRDNPSSLPRLQSTQSMVHIRLSKPGTINLKGVSDPSGVDARISYPSEITVAPCPHAQFVDGDALSRGDNIKCAAPGLNTLGEDKDVRLTLSIFGVPPLSLKWFKEINGRREYFIVEGIETEYVSSTEPSHPLYHPAQEVHVPLTVSAEAFGIHTYVLESVTDALGNLEYLSWSSAKHGDLSPESNAKISRSLRVLHRPTMAFKGCGPQKPASLRIGSNVSLVVDIQEADDLDSPWEVKVRYQPPTDEAGKSINKRLRPWQQTIEAQSSNRDLSVEADSPGEYTIVDIRGKYCEGDVLSPETCTVVELPKPTAEIEWKRIHEWCVSLPGIQWILTYALPALETLVLLPRLSFMAHRPFMSTTECNETRNRRGSWSRLSTTLAAR